MKKRVQWCDAATWAYPVKGTPECARDHVEFLWFPQPLKHLLLRVECVCELNELNELNEIRLKRGLLNMHVCRVYIYMLDLSTL